MVHMNTFGRMDLEKMDPKTEKMTKSDFLKNDHVQNFGKVHFGPEKTLRDAPQTENSF